MAVITKSLSLLTLAAMSLFCSWYTSQLDVKNVVLGDELCEYMQSPLVFYSDGLVCCVRHSHVSRFILVF